MNCQDRSKEMVEKVHRLWRRRRRRAETPKPSEAECPLSCECLAGLFKIGGMVFLDVVSLQFAKKFCHE